MSTKYELRYTNKQVRGSIRDYAFIKYSPLLTIFSPINHHGQGSSKPRGDMHWLVRPPQTKAKSNDMISEQRNDQPTAGGEKSG